MVYFSSPTIDILSCTPRDMYSSIRLSRHFTLADLYIDSHLPFEDEYEFPFDACAVDSALFILYEVLEPVSLFCDVRIKSFIRSRLRNHSYGFPYVSGYEHGFACDVYSLDHTLDELYDFLFSVLTSLVDKYVILCFDLTICYNYVSLNICV